MRTKPLLVTIFLIILFIKANAQQKYEYMSIEFNQCLKKEIQISIDGIQYIEEKADYSAAEKNSHNQNPFLKKVHEYEGQGWELMSINNIFCGGVPPTPVPIAYLKRKKTEIK